MKKFLRTFLLISLSALITDALYGQTYQWVKYGKSQGFEYGNDIATDDTGNVYVVGQYEYTTNFGGVNLVSAGQHDIFIAKYSSDGTLRWVRSAGGPHGDAGSAIGIDAAGNIYITGEFERTAKFSPNDSITSSSSNNNIYVAKYNNSGVFQWVKKIGGSSDSRGRAIAVDAAGYSYVSGGFSGTTNFGGVNLSSSGSQDIFVAKYTPSGNLVWAKKAGGNRDDRGRDITLDRFGNVFLAATFTLSANFSGTTVSDGTGSLMSGAVVKYDTSGNLKWVRKIGGCCDTTRAYGPTTDEFGNVYVTGYFSAETNIGNITLVGSGNTDAFIAKYDANGNAEWAKKYGGANEDFGNGSATDVRRQLVFFTGMFDYRADFDSVNIFSAGNRDSWVTAVDYDGNLKWLRIAGGSGRDAGYAIAADTSGNVYHTGFTNDTAYFGAYSVQGYPLADYFVAKLSPAVETSPSVASSLLNASVTNCNDVQLAWNPGNGANRMVIARAGSAVNAFPVDGNGYSASPVFGSGSELGSGNFIVYNGSGSSTVISGLSPGITYYFTVIEYNGSNLFANYYTQNAPNANVLANSFAIAANSSQGGICQGASTLLTASGNAVSYAWSPSSGLSATTGSSVTAQPSLTTTYTVTGTNGSGCQASTMVTVTVLPSPGVLFSALAPTCISTPSFTLSGGAPSGGTYSGNGVSTGVFNPAQAGLGSHLITYSYTAANGCQGSDTSVIHVTNPPQTSLAAFSSVCQSAPAFLLTGGTPAGGTYSGPGVSANQFSPAVAGAGTHTITYTYSVGTCVSSSTASITVNPAPSVSLSAFSPVCQITPAFSLSGGTPSGGTYSGPGVSNGIFNPSVAGLGTHTISYSMSSGGCTGSATSTILVQSSPQIAFAAMADVCANASPVILSGGSPSGGTYSGSGVSNGQFNPAAVGPGTYTITYSYNAGSGCSGAAQQSITVKSIPSVSLNPINPVCVNGSPVTLSGGSPAGGVYSGTGVNNGVFNPNVGVGNFPITYTVTGANACAAVATQNIEVRALPSVSLGFFTPMCTNSGPLTLSGGSPSGGVYSGTGVSGGVFTPSMGPGTYLITYTYSDAFNCSASVSNPVQVNPPPSVFLSAQSPLCSNTSPVSLQGGSPAGGSYSGTGVTNGMFSPVNGSGNYAITYTYTDINSCSGSQSANLTVFPSPEVDLGTDTVVCADAMITLQVSSTFSTVNWSDGSTTNSIQLDSAGVGMNSQPVTVTVSNSYGCIDRDTVNVTFDVCAGVENDARQSMPGVYIYPNPFISTVKLFCERPVNMKLFDVSGRLLEKRNDVTGMMETGIDLSPGTYFMEVSGNGFRKVFHIIKANR